MYSKKTEMEKEMSEDIYRIQINIEEYMGDGFKSIFASQRACKGKKRLRAIMSRFKEEVDKFVEETE